MRVSFAFIEALQLILVHRGGGEEQNSGFLRKCCLVLDDVFEVLLVFF